MTLKKFTRGFFYLIGIAAAAILLYYFIDYSIRYWDEVWNIYLVAAILLSALALFNLARWAFTPDYNYETDPFKGPYRYRIFPLPDYFDSEEAGLLSDGRSAIPHHKNGTFIGRFPETPYADEKIGDYRWGKSYEFNSKGEWMWIYEGHPTNV